jgi:cellobiose phosphorylase
MADGVTAGFVLFQNGPEYMLHPRDKATGIHYRLLPMTRGIISGIFSQEEARRHYELILRHMCHPDGVRLMDTVCPYGGGVSRRFMRAETAANFGREIGLMYVHAHLRFVEAAAKLGMAEDAWEGLKKVNPVLIGEVVKNAARRQANCYFSSSDGAFDNRYEAEAGFEKLRAGNVPVKAGWRVYSSGSGLFLNQLICNCLGLRRRNGDIVIDPVLPQYLDGLEVSYTINGRPTRIIYHLGAAGGKGVRNFQRKRRGENADSPPTDNPPLACSSGSLTKILIDGAEVPFRTLPQPYRPGGALLPAESSGTIEVFIG